jgi:hypothetical protein
MLRHKLEVCSDRISSNKIHKLNSQKTQINADGGLLLSAGGIFFGVMHDRRVKIW